MSVRFSSSRRRCRSRATRDLLVRVACGLRQSRGRQVAHAPAGNRGRSRVILGWDAAGIVEAVGRRLQPVQARRPRLLRRQHQPPRHRCGLPPGRRAHRRPQAEVAELRPGGGAAAHHADRLGADVRPHRRQARRRGGSPLAPGRRRRRRRRLDRHPARAQAHRPHRHRHRLASRRRGTGCRGLGRHHVDRPQQAVRTATEGGRLRQRRYRAGADRHPPQRRRRSPRWSRLRAASA